MTPQQFAEGYQDELAASLRQLKPRLITQAVDLIQKCSASGGTVYLCGNGGSATLASHMATDLQLAGVRAISLTDVAAVTTYANDFGYDTSFSNQVDVLGRSGDILIAISGSGNSQNVLSAVVMASRKGMGSIMISGFSGGLMATTSYGTLHINCPSSHMGVAQDLHQVVLHQITYWLMSQKKES